ncbi:hypothetical protein BCU13_004630 [Vibrio lentus]|uniref:hypothetical protein n=1 Tax=Vibrio lentus TaxID=136468 RepID=UPI000C832151|nr:hypothetical protein [Vibrio lentus]PMJ91908.1 hypothetical protein BCU13_22690 [Vibrio lentus]
MDPAVYTLIGALGGVFITQVANYFLESKKSQNLQKLKSLELRHSRNHDLNKERRIAYSKYLEAVDKSFVTEPIDLSLCVGYLYAAMIVASDETSQKIKLVFNHLKEDDIDPEAFMDAKRQLLKSMQSDLQD